MIKTHYPKIILILIVAIGFLAGLRLTRISQIEGTEALGGLKSDSSEANIFVNLAKKIMPSVVNISTISTVKSPYIQGSPDDLFRKFFGDLFRQYNEGRQGDNGEDEDEDGGQSTPMPRGKSRVPKSMALGTGVIIDSSGLILTNNHVVRGADQIKITFTEAADEKPSDAEVVGRDPEIDIALIKIKNKREMIPVVLGDSDALEVGEYVMAVGNPFGQGHSVTHGIISAKGRIAPEFPLATYLQTDAPINPGNSGGPLVNLNGEVIGINNAIDQRAHGIGFAIPITTIKKVLPQLRTKGVVARGYIGVLVDNLTPEVAEKLGIAKTLSGPVVSHVYPGEPADKAGIKPYDVILEFNGKSIKSGNDLIAAVIAVPVGEAVPIKVSRGGKEKKLTLQVGKRPGAPINGKVEGSENTKPRKESKIDLGMSLEDITPETARDLGISDKALGIVVSNISYGGPADRAGLLRGDIILEADRKTVKNLDSFYAIVKDKKSYLLRIRRGDPQGREVFQVVILDLKS